MLLEDQSEVREIHCRQLQNPLLLSLLSIWWYITAPYMNQHATYNHVHMRIIYVNMKRLCSHATYFKSHVDIIMLHVNIILLYVDINRSLVDINNSTDPKNGLKAGCSSYLLDRKTQTYNNLVAVISI